MKNNNNILILSIYFYRKFYNIFYINEYIFFDRNCIVLSCVGLVRLGGNI